MEKANDPLFLNFTYLADLVYVPRNSKRRVRT